jgi:hypothetical protein
MLDQQTETEAEAPPVDATPDRVEELRQLYEDGAIEEDALNSELDRIAAARADVPAPPPAVPGERLVRSVLAFCIAWLDQDQGR